MTEDSTEKSVSDEYYDYEADWQFFPDPSGTGGVLAQKKGEVNADEIELIRKESGGDNSPYTIEDQQHGPKDFSSELTFGRDDLTGRPLDENGQYTVTRIVKNVPYDLKAWSCGTPDCIAIDANIDPTSGDYDQWAYASNTKLLEDTSDMATAATLITPVGWGAYALNAVSITAGASAAYRENDLTDHAVKSTLNHFVYRRLKMFNASASTATRISNSTDLVGGYDAMVDPLNLPEYVQENFDE